MQLSAVRSCLSQLKAGQLSLVTHPCQTVSLIISDVIDDPLEVIASGPTCTHLIDSNKNLKALEIIDKYNLYTQIPKEVVYFLQNTKLGQLVNLDDLKVSNFLIANNKMATEAVLNAADQLGYDFKIILTNSLQGEAKLVGALMACFAYLLLTNKSSLKLTNFVLEDLEMKLKETPFNELLKDQIILAKFFEKLSGYESFPWSNNKSMKLCFVTGGEVTVTDHSTINAGSKGGRCQEMTLAFEICLNRLFSSSDVIPNFELFFSSFGTDGIDGPTDAAGAYYSCDSTTEYQSQNDDMMSYLQAHNSYNYYSKKGRLLVSGATGTNVRDIQVLTLNIHL